MTSKCRKQMALQALNVGGLGLVRGEWGLRQPWEQLKANKKSLQKPECNKQKQKAVLS